MYIKTKKQKPTKNKQSVGILLCHWVHLVGIINKWRVRVMEFNATFNNISVISWRSVLLVEETGVSVENHRPAEFHWQTLSHIIVSSYSADTIKTIWIQLMVQAISWEMKVISWLIHKSLFLDQFLVLAGQKERSQGVATRCLLFIWLLFVL